MKNYCMKSNQSVRDNNIIEIHLAVLLFGLAGLFGKILDFPPLIIVLGRVLFSAFFLMALSLYLKINLKLQKKQDYFYLLIMGGILAVHWTAFFQAIQIATVAIGLLTFSTFPIFVTFLEPYFFKEKINMGGIITAVTAFLGIMLVVPDFQIETSLTQGALWGVLSGFTYAVLSLLNRKYVKSYSSLTVAFYEQFFAASILFPFYYIYQPVFYGKDLILLALLGVIFTGISHTLFIRGLKTVKAQTAAVISCLEPVYGIICAIILLGEKIALNEIFGGVLILGSVFYATIKSGKVS